MSAFTSFKSQVLTARHEAHVEARATGRETGSPFIRSRGTFLCTADANGGQCGPNIEADCPTWDGTKAEIERLVNDVQAKYPDVAKIYIAGGFDSAERLQDFEDGNYEPWVSSWQVTFWQR